MIIMKAGTTCLIIAEGMAKPTPAEDRVVVAIDWVMPITAPESSNKTPPELPGLIAASV